MEALGRITVAGLLTGLLPIVAFLPVAFYDHKYDTSFLALNTLLPKLKAEITTWVGVSMWQRLFVA